MTAYDTAADYDTGTQEAALRLIIGRSAELGSRAALALRSGSPATRQMHLDRLIPPFLQRSDLTDAERQLLADAMWADGGTSTARPPRRTGTIRFRVTEDEEARIKDAAAIAGQTPSDYVRGKLLGDTP